MTSQKPVAAQIKSGDSSTVKVVVTDHGDGGVFDCSEIEGDEVAGEDVEDLHAFAGGKEGEESGGVEEGGYGADGDGCSGGAGGAGIVLGAAAKGDGFDVEA